VARNSMHFHQWKRREFITLISGAAAAWPLAAHAQAPPAMLRVGNTSPLPRARAFIQGFEVRMRELGYLEGQNFVLDYIEQRGLPDFAEAMRQLVDRKVDIIIASGPEDALKAAMAATKTIPIIMAAIDYDPLALGYVTSLARPMGNVTGIVLEQIDLAAKRLQLVADAFPTIDKATMFWDRQSADQWQAARDNAAKLGFDLAGVELRDYPYDYGQALAQAPQGNRSFLFVATSSLLARDRERIVQFTLLNRLPAMFVFREYVDQGGLMSYGPNRTVMSRRIADYVHRIARGAKPSELPIQRPTIFELVINLRTAKALNREFSQAMLLRADEVIE
jgi:putative tryptophan/tyrosine transport system substrate-binding protein